MLRNLALLVVLVGALCIVGCNGSSDAAPPSSGPAKATTSKDGPVSTPNAGLNPNYKGNSKSDENRAGSQTKGGG